MNEHEKLFPGEGKKIGILGVPLGYGAETKGSELGVTAIRLCKIQGKHLAENLSDLGYEVRDYGDAEIVRPERTAREAENPKYLEEMIRSSAGISRAVGQILDDGAIPVLIGGDHSIAIATGSAMSAHFKKRNESLGLIWFDAHADFNTHESSPSGNLHGMPFAILLGRGIDSLVDLEGFAPKFDPRFCAHVGARDLDIGEKRAIFAEGLRDQFFTMSDIDRRGMVACVEDAIRIASQADAGFAVTFDVDMIDPRFAPGSGTLVRGGTTYREAHVALEMVAATGLMRSFEIVEVNPMLDKSNITVELAGELVLSALGKTIL